MTHCCSSLFQAGSRLKTLFILTVFFGGLVSSWSYAGVVVIGHDLMKEKVMDKTVLSRIYTGRVVQFAGEPVLPVNLKPGNSIRAYFMQTVLQQSDDDYVAYWIVRRAIGKGVSPLELDSPQEVIKHVRSHPGAIGYVDETLVVPGVKVILSLP
jgi:hypothetical protein